MLGLVVDSGQVTTQGDIPGYASYLPTNGRVIQNIVQGCDLVMSHITHLYHLSALDFINTSTFPGMAPWTPSYTEAGMLVATGLDTTSSTANALVGHYVEALSIRRKAHTASALFSGRHPIQNALVPGGATTLYSTTYPLDPLSTDYDRFGPYNAGTTAAKFRTLWNDVRNFIDDKYIPDVVTVANAYSAYWGVGAGCQRLLSYGDYPVNTSGTLFIKRGLINTLTRDHTFDQANIVEYVDYSWYQYGVTEAGTGLHPFSGRTDPTMDQKPTGAGGGNEYSWLKAPRYMSGATPQVCEVGPLARMVATHLSSTQQTVSDADLASGIMGGAYNASQLITTALTLVTKPGGAAVTLADLYSPLGRHACRMLEAKYVADAIYNNADGGWLGQLTADASCYTYKKIPKQISAGFGLCEAPRGALGHWLKVEGRRVAKYQCIVPSTWNFSPKATGLTDRGAVEQSLMNVPIGDPATDATSAIVNILRVVHPFDCCIACAVHVVGTDGKEKLKFAIDPDGRPKNIEILK